MRLGTVTVVGVGLIGGSIGLALRGRGLAARVVGFGRDERRLERAHERGAIDEAETDPRRAFQEAEVVIICTPVSRIPTDVASAARLAPVSALVTDAGSTKADIVQAAESDSAAAALFVGAHPIAGGERSGVEFARGDLFENQACVLTPTQTTDAQQLRRAEDLWRAIGCRLLHMSPDQHDDVLARVSHLPHAVAAALASAVGSDVTALAGGGYRDSTRIAASDPAMWTAIFLQNRARMLDALTRFEDRVSSFRELLERGDEEGLSRWWNDARTARLAFERAETSAAPRLA